MNKKEKNQKSGTLRKLQYVMWTIYFIALIIFLTIAIARVHVPDRLSYLLIGILVVTGCFCILHTPTSEFPERTPNTQKKAKKDVKAVPNRHNNCRTVSYSALKNNSFTAELRLLGNILQVSFYDSGKNKHYSRNFFKPLYKNNGFMKEEICAFISECGKISTESAENLIETPFNELAKKPEIADTLHLLEEPIKSDDGWCLSVLNLTTENGNPQLHWETKAVNDRTGAGGSVDIPETVLRKLNEVTLTEWIKQQNFRDWNETDLSYLKSDHTVSVWCYSHRINGSNYADEPIEPVSEENAAPLPCAIEYFQNGIRKHLTSKQQSMPYLPNYMYITARLLWGDATAYFGEPWDGAFIYLNLKTHRLLLELSHYNNLVPPQVRNMTAEEFHWLAVKYNMKPELQAFRTDEDWDSLFDEDFEKFISTF